MDFIKSNYAVLKNAKLDDFSTMQEYITHVFSYGAARRVPNQKGSFPQDSMEQRDSKLELVSMARPIKE